MPPRTTISEFVEEERHPCQGPEQRSEADRQRFLDAGILESVVDLLLSVVQGLGTDVVLQLLQGVELGHVPGEIVVLGGHDGLGDLVDLHMEHNRLAGQVLMVVFGEGDVDVLLLAGAHADHLLLKAGNEGMRAQLQVIVLALAAVEGNAVQGAQEVDVGGVAVLGGAVHGLGSSHILSHPVQFRLDLSLGDFRLGLLHFQVLVLAQSDLRVQLGGQGADESSVSVRLIDCVGFMVEGANGHLEGDGYRMVHTPWFEEEIPFSDAARIGTEKVIKDHATIGIVVTTDGSIGELPRENYVEAEQTAVEKLKEIGKPYVIVLNSVRPYSSETLALKESLEQEYQAVVVPVNCQQMHREDLVTVAIRN